MASLRPSLHPLLVHFALGAAVASGGCESQVERLCGLSCDCTKCTDDQRTSCENGSQASYDSSEEKGCTGKADEYLACYEEKFECKDGEVDVSACDVKKKAWFDCLSGTTTEETVCDKATQKLVEECQVESDPTTEGECEGVAECSSQCLLDASCEEIREEAEGDLVPCLEACLAQGAGGSQ